MVVSARADLLGRLRKSIIFSLLALLHLSHTMLYDEEPDCCPFLCYSSPKPWSSWIQTQVSQAVLWQWSITHTMQFVLPFHYKPLLSCKWLSHTSAVQLDISYALGGFCGVKFSQNLGLWTLSGWFVVLLVFLNSHGQILGWYLQFTTTMCPASCCCYVGKLQTLQKALSFHDTANSYIGISLFWTLSFLS